MLISKRCWRTERTRKILPPPVPVRKNVWRSGQHILPVCAVTMGNCLGKAPEPTPSHFPTQSRNRNRRPGHSSSILLLILAAIGGIGALVYFKFIKNKPKTKGNDQLDNYDYGEDDTDQEDEDPWEANETDEESEDKLR